MGRKLSACFAEDEKVSLDELQEKIAEFEDHVQSTDITAMQSKFVASLDSLPLLTVSSSLQQSCKHRLSFLYGCGLISSSWFEI